MANIATPKPSVRRFYGTITSDPERVDAWVSSTKSNYIKRNNGCNFVGLAAKYSLQMDKKASLLQLHTGRSNCLVIQLHYMDEIPKSLREFLGNSYFTFVGVDIARDIEKLRKDYGLRFSCVSDVRELAMKCWKHHLYSKLPELNDIAYVADEIISVPKPERCDWESRVLDEDQIKYACFEIELGKHCMQGECILKRFRNKIICS